jgi:hypothetical protein
MKTLEVPLANPAASPMHVSSDYYYRIPVRPIYKQYPVYAPGKEPAGYWEWLQKQEPDTCALYFGTALTGSALVHQSSTPRCLWTLMA